MSDDQASPIRTAAEAVEAAARAAWKADMVQRAMQRGQVIPDTFDFAWAWDQCSSMPLSGPGFVAQWHAIAEAVLATRIPAPDPARAAE